MSTPALNLKRETPLDRRDPHECLIDNLSRCRDLEAQKTVLIHYDAGIRIAERQRLTCDLLGQAENDEALADELAEESRQKRRTAEYVRRLLELIPG